MLGIDEEGEGAAALKPGDVGHAEHRGGISGPDDPVAPKVPAIGGLAHGLEDRFEVERQFEVERRLVGVTRLAAQGLAPALAKAQHASSARLPFGTRGRPMPAGGKLFR